MSPSDKTREINSYLYKQFLPDRRNGIQISEDGFIVDILPDLPFPPLDNKPIDKQNIVSTYFPGSANQLARINGYPNPDIALFQDAVRSRLFSVMLAKWYSKGYLIARLRGAKYTPDLSQLQMAFDVHERKWV